MLRRASSAAFALALVFVTACGHQVTPSPSNLNNDLAGHISVKFGVNAPLDFTNVVYVIAIDMCGSGVPYPQALFTGFNSYTFSFLVGGGFGSTALPVLYQYGINSNSTGNVLKFQVNNLNPSTTQFIPNYNGTGSEFDFTFLRSDLNNPFNLPLPCPNSTPVPTISPTVSPGATPTASPTPTPLASGTTPAPSPTPTPTGLATQSPYLTTWTFNLMTFAPNQTPLDSLGYGGPADDTFSGIVVDTTQTVAPNVFRGTPQTIPQNPAAYITYGEVDNYP